MTGSHILQIFCHKFKCTVSNKGGAGGGVSAPLGSGSGGCLREKSHQQHVSWHSLSPDDVPVQGEEGWDGQGRGGDGERMGRGGEGRGW